MIEWIKKRLGITSLNEKIKEIESSTAGDYYRLSDRLRRIHIENEELKAMNKFLIDQFNVSADIGTIESHRNWAVLSIKGNRDYVKFVDLSQRDIREIQLYLKQFEGTNRTVDSPFSFDFFK